MLILQKKYTDLQQGYQQALRYQQTIEKQWNKLQEEKHQQALDKWEEQKSALEQAYQQALAEWEKQTSSLERAYQQALAEWEKQTSSLEQAHQQALAEWEKSAQEIQKDKISQYVRMRRILGWSLLLLPFVCSGDWIIGSNIFKNIPFIPLLLLLVNVFSCISFIGLFILFVYFHDKSYRLKKYDLNYFLPKPIPPVLPEEPSSPTLPEKPSNPSTPTFEKQSQPCDIISTWFKQLQVPLVNNKIGLEDDTHIIQDLNGQRPVGVRGEEILLYALRRRLSDDHIAIHSLLIHKNKHTKKGDDIDVLVIAPSGIWILESKYLSGYVKYYFDWEHIQEKVDEYGKSYFLNKPISQPFEKQWNRQKVAIQKLLPNHLKHVKIYGGIAFTHPKVTLELENPPCKCLTPDEWSDHIYEVSQQKPKISRETQLEILDILLKNSYRFKQSNQKSALPLVERINHQCKQRISEYVQKNI